jgi:hypothetical protein
MSLECFQLDVDNAFARADMDQPCYVQPPTGFESKDPLTGVPHVCRLDKALYGTKQAARLWHQKMRKFLLDNDWSQFESDPGVYIRKSKHGIQLIGLYVDDIIHACSNSSINNKFHSDCNQVFPTKNQGPLDWILGMEVKRDFKNKILTINQTQKIRDLLKDTNMLDSKSVSTPMDEKWTYGTAPPLSPTEQTEFRSRLGSIAFIEQCTRPDISHAVNMLCRYMSKPNINCTHALNRLLRYLNGTQNLGLTYTFKNNNSLKLEVFADANYGGDDTVQARSTSGFIIYFGGGPISWGSRLQKVIAQSSAEAELISAFNASTLAVYHRSFLEELGLAQSDSTIIWEDNEATIQMSKNPVNHQRCRHISLKYFYIRDLVESGIIKLEYIKTIHQIADIFTKATKREDFLRLRQHLVQQVK